MAAQPPAIPQSSEELLEADHEVRRLWPLVEETVGETLRGMARDSGGISHDPARMFAVWMYALMKGDGSSRKLEELCRYDLRYAYLCGGVRPDHVTLSRFRRRFEDCLPGLFEEVTSAGRKRGLLGSRPLAVDGTKVAGARTQWRRAMSAGFDEESSTMTDGHGSFVTGHNAQVAADTETTFVGGCHVTTDKNDLRVLGEVLSAVESQSGELPPAVVADAGYDGSANHEALASHGVAGYVVPRSESIFFTGPDGLSQCRAGRVPQRRRTLKQGVAYDVYVVRGCCRCPHAASCGSGKGKSRETAVQAGVPLSLRTENSERCASDEGRRLLRLRGPTVELVFARLKALFGFRRFSLRNLSGARLEFALLVLAYDLWLLKESVSLLLRWVWAAFCRETRPAAA